MGFDKEVAMIGQAHEHGFFTAVYVFNPEEARAMAAAGADAIIAHLGLTVGGSIGLAPGDALTLDEVVPRVQAIGEAAWQVNPEAILLCHGGPIATPADASYVLAHTDAAGFVGASSMERLPVEVAMAETTRAFKAIPISSNGRGATSKPAASPVAM
jgi:predicted TIM-barrel enzyme